MCGYQITRREINRHFWIRIWEWKKRTKIRTLGTLSIESIKRSENRPIAIKWKYFRAVSSFIFDEIYLCFTQNLIRTVTLTMCVTYAMKIYVCRRDILSFPARHLLAQLVVGGDRTRGVDGASSITVRWSRTKPLSLCHSQHKTCISSDLQASNIALC